MKPKFFHNGELPAAPGAGWTLGVNIMRPGVTHIRVKATRKDVLITQFRRGVGGWR